MNKKVEKKIYDQPSSGRYRFEYFMGDGFDWVRQSMDVKILGETDKRFLIKIPLAIRNHEAGDEFWVSRKKVDVYLNTQDYWFNNFESKQL